MTEHRPLLALIDGHALAFRAFHALVKQGLRASTGEPTYAVFGFISILLGMIQEHHPHYLAVAFDIGPTFRDRIYPAYKAGRAETPAEFEQQLERIKQLVRAFNIPIYTAEDFEADDVIGTLARQATTANIDTMILTGDTDTLQLVDEHVHVLLANPYGQKTTTTIYDLERVRERYKGLTPTQLTDLRGLKGDTSDNIPGVKGIGEDGAINLLKEFRSVEELYTQLDNVPNRYRKALEGQETQAKESKYLATIRYDAPVTLDLHAATLHDYDRSEVIRLFQELEIGASMIKRLPDDGRTTPIVTPPETPPVTQQQDMFAAPPAAETDPLQLSMFDLTSTVDGRTTALTSLPGNVAHPPLGNYQTICDEQALETLIAALTAAPGFAFDTEVTGLRPFQDELVGISLAIESGSAWYIPVGHREGQQLPRALVLDALRPLFSDAHKPKYAHNAKFDMEVLLNAGIEVHGLTFDTMLAAALLDKRKGLKDLAFYELKIPEAMTSIEELIGKGKNQITIDAAPIPHVTNYAGADADMTLRLVGALAPQLAEQTDVQKIFNDYELPLIPVLVRMEQAGIGLDAAYLTAMGRRMGERLSDLEQQIYQKAETPFNINSGQQLSDILFDKIGLKTTGLSKTKTGQYSLTADVLDKMRNDHPIIDLILQYRQLTKLKSTYVDTLPLLVNPLTGRVHTSFSQIGAATGRLSSSDPNLQNIPTRTDEGREIRRAFVAAPGCVFIAADYSQIELRVLAHITKDPNLVQAFLDDQDIHAATASQLFNVPIEHVDKQQRRLAKTTVFGIVYGISSFGLAARTDLSRTEAQALIDAMFARFPGLRRYIDQTLADGREIGYVQSLFGRRRSMPDLRVSGPRRQAAEREAINAPIQATAADIMKLAMIRVDEQLRSHNLKTRMLLQVHDELIFETPHAEVAQVVALVRQHMETAYPDLCVPLKVDVEQGPNWEELTEIPRSSTNAP